MKTYAPRPRDIQRRWYVIDANDAVLGRLASEVAAILRGKHKPIYAPHADTGDHVIVINAKGIRLTGGKESKKVAYRHSGFPGGITETGYDRLLDQRPSFVVEKAVKGMLPKNSLGRSMIRKLQVYEGAEHPHAAQSPQALALGEAPRWDGLPAPAPRPKAPARKPAKRAAARPATARSTSKKRTTKKSTAKSSTTKSAAKKPAAKKSAAKKPAAKKTSAAKKASTAASRTRRAKKKEEGD